MPASQRTLNRWFDTDAVQQPAPNQFGSDAAINAVRADPIRNLNATISKFFGIREGHRIQFRAEFFNAFNHPHFGDPDALRGSGTFGKVTSADPGRDIQLALKYQF